MPLAEHQLTLVNRDGDTAALFEEIVEQHVGDLVVDHTLNRTTQRASPELGLIARARRSSPPRRQ